MLSCEDNSELDRLDPSPHKKYIAHGIRLSGPYSQFYGVSVIFRNLLLVAFIKNHIFMGGIDLGLGLPLEGTLGGPYG